MHDNLQWVSLFYCATGLPALFNSKGLGSGTSSSVTLPMLRKHHYYTKPLTTLIYVMVNNSLFVSKRDTVYMTYLDEKAKQNKTI